MKCLENLIRISATDCLCTLEGLSEEQKIEIKQSLSGLYLDKDLPGGVNINEIKTLNSCGDYFRMAKESINSAKTRFESDIEIAIGERYKNARPTFKGELGRMTFTSSLNKSKQYQFLKVEPNTLSDATLKLNGGRSITNANDNLNVYILAQKGDETPVVIHTTTVEVLANRFGNFALPQNNVFPLSMDGKKMIYYFV